MNIENTSYNFKSLIKDRSLFWRYTWVVLISLILIITICMGIGKPLDDMMKKNTGLNNVISETVIEKYAFIDNNTIPPFYKEKFSTDRKKQFIALNSEHWQEVAQKDSINYIIEFNPSGINTYSINIWVNNANEYDALRNEIQSLEFEKANLPIVHIEKKNFEKDNNKQLAEIYNYIGYGLNTLICFLVLFFAFWSCRYIATDAIQMNNNNTYSKTLFYVFIAAFIAVLLVLLTIYRAIMIPFNGSAMIAANYLKSFIDLKYVLLMSVLSAITSFIIANIWLLHNIILSKNLYKNMRNGNKYYLIIVYLCLIGGIGAYLSDGFIILPIINLFTIGKLLISNTISNIDILIFLISNILLAGLLLYFAKKKYSNLQA